MTADREAAIREAIDWIGGRAIMVPGAPKHHRDAGVALASLLAELAAARERERRFNASIVAHHNIAHLSEDAIAESFGGTCRICARAQAERS